MSWSQMTPNVVSTAAVIFPWRIVQIAANVDNTVLADDGAGTNVAPHPIVGITTGDTKSSTLAVDEDAHAELAGDPVTLQPGLVKLACAAAAIDAGEYVMTAAGGKVTVATHIVTDQIVGIALQSAEVDGDIIEILWAPQIAGAVA